MKKNTPSPKPRGGKSEPKLSPPPVQSIIIWLLIFITVPLVVMWASGREKSGELSQKAFEEALRAQRIHTANIDHVASGIATVTGKWKATPEAEELTGYTAVVYFSDEMEAMIRDNVITDFDTDPPSGIWSNLLLPLLPIVLLVVIIYYLFVRQMRNAGKGAMQFGKSRAKLVQSLDKVTFSDVAGVTEAKEEVEEIIEYLKDPDRFHRLGGKMPKGVLMVGPPGTGKTLLAKAIAGEADVPFFNISGSDFVEMFVGVGASRVRDMFEQGKKHAPCIIFIDEIDAVGRSRFSGIGGGHDEREQTLNALLVEMDGFEGNSGVIVIAATNRPDVLDPALLRPGRFDRQISIDLPDLGGRLEILKVHSKRVKLSDKVTLEITARGTPGFSGADLANLVNEAALLAARTGKQSVEQDDMEEARDKVRWGKERRSRVMDEHDKRITAFHEAGHALVGLHCENATPLHKVTIIPRGMAFLGAAMYLPTKDKYTHSRSELNDELAVAMGGRIAEELMFAEITNGASMDIKQATNIARRMVCEWGMSDKMGLLRYGEREEHIYVGRDITRNIDYSEQTASQLDIEIKGIVDTAYNRAKAILTEHRDQLELLGTTLLEKETMDVREIKLLLGMIEPDDVVAEAPKKAEDEDPFVQPATEAEIEAMDQAFVPRQPPRVPPDPIGEKPPPPPPSPDDQGNGG